MLEAAIVRIGGLLESMQALKQFAGLDKEKEELSDMGTLELYSKELNRIGKEMAKETANGQVVTSELIDRLCDELYDEGLKMIFKRGIAIGIVIGS